jgi:transposase
MSKGVKRSRRGHLRAVDVDQEKDMAVSAAGAESSSVTSGQESSAPAPDSEVPARASRRAFTAEFKRRILEEVDRCAPGELGAVLRRNGLYYSYLTSWRRQRDEGTLAGLTPRKRGRKSAPRNLLAEENARLERENKRLEARAQRAEGLVAVQKKMAELLGEEIPPEEELFDAQRRGLPIPPWRKKGR